LSQNNSGGSATAGIRAVGLFLQLQQFLKHAFKIKTCLTKEFMKYVGYVKVGV
jgi:hypothetical protein